MDSEDSDTANLPSCSHMSRFKITMTTDSSCTSCGKMVPPSKEGTTCNTRLCSDCHKKKIAQSKEQKLQMATDISNLEVLTYLLQKGADPNAIYDNNSTPLHLAACRGNLQIIQQLLNFGADPNALDCLGNTPLHIAIMATPTNKKVVEILLGAGADVCKRDCNGDTALDIAREKLEYLGTDPSDGALAETCATAQLLLAYKQKQEDDTMDATALQEGDGSDTAQLMRVLEKLSLK